MSKSKEICDGSICGGSKGSYLSFIYASIIYEYEIGRQNSSIGFRFILSN